MNVINSWKREDWSIQVQTPKAFQWITRSCKIAFYESLKFKRGFTDHCRSQMRSEEKEQNIERRRKQKLGILRSLPNPIDYLIVYPQELNNRTAGRMQRTLFTQTAKKLTHRTRKSDIVNWEWVRWSGVTHKYIRTKKERNDDLENAFTFHGKRVGRQSIFTYLLEWLARMHLLLLLHKRNN